MISQPYKQYLELQKHKAAIANIRALFKIAKSINIDNDPDNPYVKEYLRGLADINKMIDRIL